MQQKSGACSAITTNVATNGATTISCTLQGSTRISGKVIQWVRTADKDAVAGANGAADEAESVGAWTCETDVVDNLKPKNCEYKSTVVKATGVNA